MPEFANAKEGRRSSQRRELLAQIEQHARQMLEEKGASSVTMRAIARAVGMAPASLYNYFDSLDDVFTMLLLSSYKSLAEATSAAVIAFAKAPPCDRAFVGILAHRRWALEHRNEFNLVFTDQLPGYSAPLGGPTVTAQIEVFRPIIDAFDELITQSNLTPIEMNIFVWSTFHGAVSLEVNHHFDWLDDTAYLHDKIVRNALVGLGLPQPSKTIRKRFERWAAKQ